MLLGFSGQGLVQGQQGCEGSMLRSCSLQMHYLMAQQQPFTRVSLHAPFSGGLQALVPLWGLPFWVGLSACFS